VIQRMNHPTDNVVALRQKHLPRLHLRPHAGRCAVLVRSAREHLRARDPPKGKEKDSIRLVSLQGRGRTLLFACRGSSNNGSTEVLHRISRLTPASYSKPVLRCGHRIGRHRASAPGRARNGALTRAARRHATAAGVTQGERQWRGRALSRQPRPR
jgi:hypothetical protein